MKPCISLGREICAWVGSKGCWACAVLGLFFLTTQPSARAANDPLEVWHLRTTGGTRGLTYANGQFVTGGYGGIFQTSPDGGTWTQHSSFSNDFSAMGAAYGNGLYVFPGYRGFATSTNGRQWTYLDTANNSWLWDIVFAEGRFVAVGTSSVYLNESDGIALTSSNGIHWEQHTLLPRALFRGVAYGDGYFVASGHRLDGPEALTAVSTNGIHWRITTNPPPIRAYRITYGEGKFVALGDGIEVLESRSLTNDVLPWKQSTTRLRLLGADSPVELHTISYVEGQFIAVGSSGAFLISPDGTNWARKPFPLHGTSLSVSAGRDRFVVGGGGIYQSDPIRPSSPLYFVRLQPREKLVGTGRPYANSVIAESEPVAPLTYQWRVNGVNLPSATNSTITIPHATHDLTGLHDVVISSAGGSTTSSVANIRVLDPSGIRLQPQPQSVAQGGSITLSVTATGAPPISYRWRRNGQTVSYVGDGGNASFLTVPNVLSNAVYSVVVSNLVTHPGELSAAAPVTVLDDTDHDGLPDDFESANRLDPKNTADALLDSDGDGLPNADEYLAGTDPRDANSFLRIDRISTEAGAHIHFNAAAGKTYTIQYTDRLDAPDWKRLTDLAASATSGATSVADPNASTARFYRLITPRTE